MYKTKNCIDCNCEMENVHIAQKRCSECQAKFRKIDDVRRWQNRYLAKIVGASTAVDIRPCLVCRRLTVLRATKQNVQRRRFCSGACERAFYTVDEKERNDWARGPFTFKLSAGASARRMELAGNNEVAPCSFCGSQRILSNWAKNKYVKGSRVFCDEQCASEWRSLHYASPNHKPMEDLRQKARAKRALLDAERRRKAEEREIKKLITPPNAKTPGYYTCTVCGKTEWVEQHSQKRFCSHRCRRKSLKAKLWKKNRRHKIRSKVLSQNICLNELMKKHKSRCKHCNTLCVKPEGYNHPNEATMDHIMPLSKGGLHLWNNVQLLCRQCNTAKRDKVLPGTQMMLRFDE